MERLQISRIRSGMTASVEQHAVRVAQWGGDKMFKNIALATVLAVAVTGPTLANSCPKHMASIDQALATNPKLEPAQLAEVKKLRADGETLHKQGKHAESEAALGQAESILGIKKM
jgi:hypothetical protein